ncbi:origin of replication complex subunit 6-like [Euphorbia lathyris]|uniref:origin of replication complex subunit 6-like n=1 Tax=Euphorbia lathyris TaxID=212925 RepID=UPI003313BAA1
MRKRRTNYESVEILKGFYYARRPQIPRFQVKAYSRSFNSLQNSLGVKTKSDIRELTIQFRCVRFIPFMKNGLSLFQAIFDRQTAIREGL